MNIRDKKFSMERKEYEKNSKNMLYFLYSTMELLYCFSSWCFQECFTCSWVLALNIHTVPKKP